MVIIVVLLLPSFIMKRSIMDLVKMCMGINRANFEQKFIMDVLQPRL